jgi:hypothetical protein
MSTPGPSTENPFRVAVQNLTVVAALTAYAGLAVYVIWQTWDAKAGKAPTIPGVQSAALGALAVALGAGYAVILGIPSKPASQFGLTDEDKGWKRIVKWIRSQSTKLILLGFGSLLYLVIGAAIGVTYAFNEAETPTVIKTIAVGFGGYVIAYLGAAYQAVGD